ncbi:MAG: hypothetical protein IJD01_04345 [Clostridia bacterium]|nr:hypothetical protein [Clostridia bacterium]
MTKGAVHQIIEIQGTSDPYFERILLFVKPSCSDRSTAFLEAEGRRALSEATPYTGLRHNRAMCWFKRCALVLGGAIGGILLGLLGG